VLFHYPDKALVSRIIPKNTIYQKASANTKIKDLFVEQIDSIVWEYKLATETINLPATPLVSEIQIFDIRLKGEEIDLDVLKVIDSAIPFQIFFRVFTNSSIKVFSIYKALSDTTHKNFFESYSTTEWLSLDTQTHALPIAVNLQNLHEQLFRALLTHQPKPDETLLQQLTRLDELRQRQIEYQKLEVKLHKEKQFNRKVEINNQLQKLKPIINTLTS
jgi:hypothetical protein